LSESEHQRKIFVEYNSRKNSRVFRNNVGMGWAGKVLTKKGNYTTLANARPVTFGLCKGSADLIGIKTITITPEMVGREIGQFLAVECKAKTGIQKKDQENFQALIEKLGGKYVLSKEKK